jgi:hypothetical protein
MRDQISFRNDIHRSDPARNLLKVERLTYSHEHKFVRRGAGPSIFFGKML